MANPTNHGAEKSPFESVRERLGEEMMANISPLPVSKREFNEELKLWNSIFKTSNSSNSPSSSELSNSCNSNEQQMPALTLSKDADSAWRAYENSEAGRKRREEIGRSMAS